MKKRAKSLLILAVVSSAVILGGDGLVAHFVLGQWRSTRFLETEGRILASEVAKDTSGNDVTYDANVRYEYRVAGQRYESTRVRFGLMSDNSGKWAQQTVRENRVGARRPVYYDPFDPSNAVLQTGVGVRDFCLVLLLIPFNAGLIGAWWAAVSARRAAPPCGGAMVETREDELRVRFPGMSPAASALMVFGLVSIVTSFGVAMLFGLSPPLGFALGGVLFAIVVALASFGWQRHRLKHGPPDLIVSLERRTLTRLREPQPPFVNLAEWWDWRKMPAIPVVVPVEKIRGIEVQAQATAVAGDDESSFTSYVVVAIVDRYDRGDRHEVELAAWYFDDHAEAFAAWLRTGLGLPA